MVVLRATRKVLRTLPESGGDVRASDTALGDWYVNRLVVERRPLLLLVSSTSRLAMLELARDVRHLPERLAELVGQRLRRLGVGESLLPAELDAMATVRVGRTVDRSIVGQMVDFAKAVPYYLPASNWDRATLALAEDRLAETPCLSGRPSSDVVWPHHRALELLSERWAVHAAGR